MTKENNLEDMTIEKKFACLAAVIKPAFCPLEAQLSLIFPIFNQLTLNTVTKSGPRRHWRRNPESLDQEGATFIN